jgi:hypothetical protein
MAIYAIYFTIIQMLCLLTLFISRLVDMAKSKDHTNHKVSIPVWKAMVARLRVMAVIQVEDNG